MTRPRRQANADAKCIRCGCTDRRACPEGCGWIVVDRRRRIGICSSAACTRGASLARLQSALRRHRSRKEVEREHLDRAWPHDPQSHPGSGGVR